MRNIGLLLIVAGCATKETARPRRVPSLVPIALGLRSERAAWNIVDAVLLPSDRYAVLDSGRRIVVVDSVGTTLDELPLSTGRSDDLPTPFALASSDAGAVAVADLTTGRVRILTPELRIDRTLETSGMIRGLWWTPAGLIVKVVHNGALEFVDFGADGARPGAILARIDLSESSPRTCAYCAASVDSRGTVAVGRSDSRYEIGRATGRRFVGAYWRLPNAPRPSLSAAEQQGIRRRSDSVVELLRQKGVSQQVIQQFVELSRARLTTRPVFQGHALAFDDDGSLWTQPSIDAGRSTVLSVFAPDGSFRGTDTVGAYVSLLAIGRGRVLTRAQLPNGRSELFVYRVLPRSDE